jgi:feruloyl esterase
MNHRLLRLAAGVVLAAAVADRSGARVASLVTDESFSTKCADLGRRLTAQAFPITTTQITMAAYHAEGALKAGDVPLPSHCQVQGVVNPRVGVDGVKYGDIFELRLPANWNGRFMFQGGGGTEGALPPAYGVAGTATPTLAKGYAVLTTDGGHESNLLKNPVSFGLDPQARLDWGYQTIDRATRTAKFLVKQMYDRAPDYSYSIGCSLGGHQGMVFSQRFPAYYDGIVAGAPVMDVSSISLSETNGLQAVAAIVPKDKKGRPQYYKSFSASDQKLFTHAIITACDAVDGLKDGVIDDMDHCAFDPRTFVFPSGEPLMCSGAKTESCLSAQQIGVIERVHRGPRTSAGKEVVLPSGSVAQGYPYDGGFMSEAGQPSRLIGSPTSLAGNVTIGTNQIPYIHFDPPIPTFDVLQFDYDKDVAKEMRNNPQASVNTDLSTFKARGGKILFYHGKSDPGPIATNTINYYNDVVKEHGSDFIRLFLIPNMGHCRGGAATDQFDTLTPIVNWVEQGIAPDTIIASGSHFDEPMTTRERPLCAYPKHAKYIGPAGGNIGVAKNYACVN